ncbi:MAG TPA: hypothetical protein VIY09_00915 [Rhizomicrobium sp.]
MLRLNPAQLVLWAICGALAVLLGYMLLAPLPEIALPQVAPPSQPADDTPLARFDAPSRQAFAEVDDRSVFNPLRARVSAPFQPGAASATNLPADLSLVGVILDEDTKLALFKFPLAPLAVGVPVGGSVEGWQVTRIEPDMVTLRAGGPEQVMRLSANKAAVPLAPNVARPFGPPNFPRPPNFARNNPNANNNNGNNENNNNNNDSDDDDNNNN